MTEARAAATGHTFSSNVLWNMGSLGFLAAAGLLLNYIIGRVHGAEALGLFNIVFAIYILLSQLGVLGVHFSVLRAVAEHQGRDQDEVDRSISGGLALVALLSLAVTLAALAATPLMARIYAIDGMRAAWLMMLPGLFCFALNKFLLNAINGAQHMRAFAALQSLRYFLILLALAVMLALGAPGPALTGVLSVAEVTLLAVLYWYVGGRVVRRWRLAESRAWVREHFGFGLKVFASGTIGELNTRVDVLILGALLDGTRAGIYSMALLLAEGLAQAIVVVRANLNPMITHHFRDGEQEALAVFGRRVSGYVTLFMAAAGLVVVVGFALLVGLLLPGKGFEGAVMPLAILVAGLVVASPYMPFGMIFSQTGQPFLQTKFAAAVLVANIGFNLLLIPFLGVNGAALGTALSYVVTAGLLIVLMRRIYGIKLWI